MTADWGFSAFTCSISRVNCLLLISYRWFHFNTYMLTHQYEMLKESKISDRGINNLFNIKLLTLLRGTHVFYLPALLSSAHTFRISVKQNIGWISVKQNISWISVKQNIIWISVKQYISND